MGEAVIQAGDSKTLGLIAGWLPVQEAQCFFLIEIFNNPGEGGRCGASLVQHLGVDRTPAIATRWVWHCLLAFPCSCDGKVTRDRIEGLT